MTNYVDSEILEDRLEHVTLEDAQKNQKLMDDLNYFVDEGFIEIEETDGEIRAYPTR